MSREQFLSEPITPDAGTADPLSMARGEAGLPAGFTWRGKHYEIFDLLEAWKSNADAGEGSRYLRRHWFKVRAGSGEVFTLYCLRQAPSGQRKQRRWWVYCVEN